MVTVSAPGKIHLIGEHAVVYGKPAILATVGKRITIRAEQADDVTVVDEAMGPPLKWSVKECREAAARAMKAWDAGAKRGDFSEVFALAKGSDFKKVAIGYVLTKLEIEG